MTAGAWAEGSSTVLRLLHRHSDCARGTCIGVMPRVQSKLSRAPHAHRGAKLLEDLQKAGNNRSKTAMVRFRGAREKGAMALVECLGVSNEDKMEGSRWSETLSRSLGSNDAVEPVGVTCHDNGCRRETTRLHVISCIKTGWSTLTHNEVLHHAVARSLRESNVQITGHSNKETPDSRLDTTL